MPRNRLFKEEAGYGAAHRRLRKYWARKVKTGEVFCARQGPNCVGMPILPDQPWDLGHADDGHGYNGPECVPCNRGEGGRRGARITNNRGKVVKRSW